ncbi:YhbP family protein [Microvirgula curvata]|uniref:pyridoxamine 5'-phosphate oxidase family protein n=1 Tax=Microvirgula sp. AG722 TaxID=2183901 RepID=UPI000DC5B3F4|nr:pyridoxamine 5'-phosphate oxidase family protein [Microvirgula sp. AG722]RAS14357.1 hypothetical protein DFO50_11045 [Microvirgula sp. AG722]
MPPLPATIRDFILGHHVLSLATCDANGPWAASCFYAFDQADVALLILSSGETRHGRHMRDRPQVAGTISGQPQAVHEICGLQFTARAILLEQDLRDRALQCYIGRHPQAGLHTAPVWRLALEQLKFTDNRQQFGHKTRWSRSGN